VIEIDEVPLEFGMRRLGWDAWYGVVLGASLHFHGELKSCFDLALARGVCCGCAMAAALFICFGGYLID
jgi:hypothetical protein